HRQRATPRPRDPFSTQAPRGGAPAPCPAAPPLASRHRDFSLSSRPRVAYAVRTTRTKEAMPMFDLAAVQAAVRDLGLDGWLLYDFRSLNVLARRVIGLAPDQMLSRRWFYFVPAEGEPRKLVHRIEPHALDHVPGPHRLYLRWQELEAGVAALVGGCRRVAMTH